MSTTATYSADAKAEAGSDAFMEDLEDWCARSTNAPAVATVYQNVRRRMRILKATQKRMSNDSWPNLLLTAPPEVRQLCMQYGLDLPPHSDADVELGAKRAKSWLVNVMRSQTKLLSRQHGQRILNSAVEKELMGAKDCMSDMEKLYMVLASDDAPEPESRLRMAFLLVLQFNFAERLADIEKLATQRSAAITLAASMDAQVNTVRGNIVDRMRSIKVDHFACAIRLTTLQRRLDIVDENEGCCPICQNSYSDLTLNAPQELLVDFPIRIQHCGHIIGKGCLEQWMSTPKIDQAKYPHRTCPMCRTKIEGVPGPTLPKDLQKHIQMDRRATETLKYLVDSEDVELEECLEAIVACMSDEIACEEVLGLIEEAKETASASGGTGLDYEDDENELKAKLDELKKEKRAWGFRADGVWMRLRNEWANGGVVRREC